MPCILKGGGGLGRVRGKKWFRSSEEWYLPPGSNEPETCLQKQVTHEWGSQGLVRYRFGERSKIMKWHPGKPKCESKSDV